MATPDCPCGLRARHDLLLRSVTKCPDARALIDHLLRLVHRAEDRADVCALELSGAELTIERLRREMDQMTEERAA